MSEQEQQRAQTLGNLIQRARLHAGRTAAECAAVLAIEPENFDGVENGRFPLSLPDLEALAIFLEVPMGYFWGTAALKQPTQPNYAAFLALRHRIIAVLLRQERLKAKQSVAEVAQAIGCEATDLEAYESGQTPIPYLTLEALCRHYDAPISAFVDAQNGPLGRHEAEQRLQKLFHELSPEMQAFVTNPSNVSFLETARRLSSMNVEGLRRIAESILDITY